MSILEDKVRISFYITKEARVALDRMARLHHRRIGDQLSVVIEAAAKREDFLPEG